MVRLMNYVTVEADLDHDRIVPLEGGVLPEKARVLVTVLRADEKAEPRGKQKATPEEIQRRLDAFHALQRSLNLTPEKAKAWMDTIRDSRR